MGISGHGTGIHRHDGLTVLELLVTLTIAAILLVTGVPSFRQFTSRQHLQAAVGNLHNDLLLARSEAVHLGATVVACPGEPAAGCSGTSDWGRGWIVFADDNGDRQFQPQETILRQGQVFEDVVIAAGNGRTSIRFFPDGSAPGSNGTIGFCGRGGPRQARKLVVSNVGRIRRDVFPDIDASRCPEP